MKMRMVLLLAGFLFTCLADPLPGQVQRKVAEENGGGNRVYPIAGSHLLWKENAEVARYIRLHPDMFAQMRLAKTAAWGFTVGSAHQWYTVDFTNSTRYLTNSTCRAVGSNCYVFVEDSLWGTRVSQTAVDSVEHAFDLRTPANPAKGIYQTDVDAFGNPPDVDSDPRIIILILNIRDGWNGTGGFVAGYFSGVNETNQGNSNHAEIYFLDANPLNLLTPNGLQDGMSTTAHEFQHMIHFNYDVSELAFVNEGCSLVAEVNCGYPIFDQSGYVGETNHYLLDWRTSDNVAVLWDYSRAARFTTYVRDQLGMGVFKPIVASTLTGIAGLDAGFQAYGTPLRFADLFRTWLVANVLDDTTVNRAYGYVYPNLPKAQGTTYISPNVSTTSGVIQALGASYVLYKGGSNLSISFTASNAALLIKAVEIGASSSRVLDVTPGVTFNEPAFGSTYTEIDFVIMNTSQTTSYSYTYQSSGTGAGGAELKYDFTEPSGYLALAALDTVAVQFDAVFGAHLDSIRVGLRRAGSINGGVWRYTGEVRPTPLGTRLGIPFTASIATTPSFPYPVPYPNWATVDLRQYAIDASSSFVVGFVCAGDPNVQTRVMVTETPSSGGHSYTHLGTTDNPPPPSSDWYVIQSNAAGDTVYSYLIRAYVSANPLATVSVYPGDANNDSVVDVRDILPLGRYYGTQGSARVNGSLTWGPQTALYVWNPPPACYADCDGNGQVNGNDVAAIIRNWHASVATGLPSIEDPRLICDELLGGIDSQPVSEGLREVRNAILAYRQDHLGVPIEFALEQNYPNPFNPSTTIRFTIPGKIDAARLSVYNVLGQVVWEGVMPDVGAGSHEFTWPGVDLHGKSASSGVYFYRLVAGKFNAVKRMILVR